MHGLTYLNNLTGWVGQRDFSLERITVVAAALGKPQDAFRSIHVSGTNGKGSTCATLSSILSAAEFKVGMTTSPHLDSIRERVVIDGEPVSDAKLSDVALRVKQKAEDLSTELSQFEAITLCAFILFHEAKVDYAIIEVGLGGRLDATNIISKPDITAVVSIAKDHQEILGETVAEIAQEKAGILKSGAPAVLGLLSPEALESIKRIAEQKGSIPLSLSAVDFCCTSLRQSLTHAEYHYKDSVFDLVLSSSLVGVHQANNIGIAVRIAGMLGVGKSAILKGVKDVYWPCRLELLRWKQIDILFDCAHNPAGITSLIKYLDLVSVDFSMVVVGALKTKNWQEMILGLAVKIKRWYIIEPESTQALSAKDLQEFISIHELGESLNFSSDYSSLVKHLSTLGQNSKVLVTGSIYMVAAVRKALGIRSRPLS